MSGVTHLEKSTFKVTDSSQFRLLFKYIFRVLPKVNKRLRYWEKRAANIEDGILRKQALSSLSTKDFHCHGGSVFAVNNEEQSSLLDLIVAYQTICDYLDNLCDRAGVTEEQAFITLHKALLDALTPDSSPSDYYSDYSYSQDSGYLNELVECCRQAISCLPSYDLIYNEAVYLAKLYIDLQVKKHIDWKIREQVLKDWAINKSKAYPFLKWQEYAASSGSTLALFALFNLAAKPDLKPAEVQVVFNGYFPWICGLHILLDYFIDQEEDIEGGDLNFTFYYKDEGEMLSRLKFFIRHSLLLASSLPQETLHQMVVEGLLAMYLSDKKVKRYRKEQIRMELLTEAGRNTKNIYYICKTVRNFI